MDYARLFPVVWLFGLLLAGCSGSEAAPRPADQEIGSLAKVQVEDLLKVVKFQPKQAPESLSILLESLEAYARDYRGGFLELRDSAIALQALYSKSAPQSEIDVQLTKLKAAADAVAVEP